MLSLLLSPKPVFATNGGDPEIVLPQELIARESFEGEIVLSVVVSKLGEFNQNVRVKNYLISDPQPVPVEAGDLFIKALSQDHVAANPDAVLRYNIALILTEVLRRSSDQERAVRLAMPIVERFIEDEDVGVRLAVMRGISDIGPAVGGLVPLLTKAINDPEVQVRDKVAETLSAIGVLAESAIPALTSAAESHSNHRIRHRLKSAIFRIEEAVMDLKISLPCKSLL